MSILMTIIFSFIPWTAEYSVKEPDSIKLTVGLVSDVHINGWLPVGQAALVTAYRDMSGCNPDGVIVLGDLVQNGDEFSMETFFDITKKNVMENGRLPIVISGNHDIGHANVSNEEARQRFIRLANEYLNYNIENIFFSKDLNGYTFICMGDESEDNWDRPEYYEEQLAMLDSELARGTENGKPVFVLTHVPVAEIHGEKHYYKNGGIEEPFNTQFREILEKYENVFCLSGHLHKGISNSERTPTYATVNGVHYLNLTSYLMANWPQGGIPLNGVGFIMEIYDNNVTFRARNYYVHTWLTAYEYVEPLV